MAEKDVLDIDAIGEEDEKDGKRLEGQVRQLEEVLAQLTQLLEVERPMREQLMVIEVVGRSAVRLAILIQTQQEIECAIWYEEDRLYQREVSEKVDERRERHYLMEEKLMKAKIDEQRMKMLKHAGRLPKKGTPEAEHPPGLEIE